jgi:hypothetical protein
MPMQMFTCSLCDKPTASDGKEYMVPLGESIHATAVRACYKCFTIVNSYETLKALEAGEYNDVLTEKPMGASR